MGGVTISPELLLQVLQSVNVFGRVGLAVGVVVLSLCVDAGQAEQLFLCIWWWRLVHVF